MNRLPFSKVASGRFASIITLHGMEEYLYAEIIRYIGDISKTLERMIRVMDALGSEGEKPYDPN